MFNFEKHHYKVYVIFEILIGLKIQHPQYTLHKAREL